MEIDEDSLMSVSPDSVHGLFCTNPSSDKTSTGIYSHPTNTRRSSLHYKLSLSLLEHNLPVLDLNSRGLQPDDAKLVKMVLSTNKSTLRSIKLGYNSLGDTGLSTLCTALSRTVERLDLGFNGISDSGCHQLCRNIHATSQLRTLYLGGNLIRSDGAYAIADVLRRARNLTQLYLMGNLLGPDGVKAITEAIIADEQQRIDGGGLQELYLGDTGMGGDGLAAVATLLSQSRRIRVLSLASCDISDDELSLLSKSIQSNENLPLETLQLSFNRITCRGMEKLSRALYHTKIKELLLDNNEIADRGAQQIANVLLPQVKSLEVLNVGFNQIKSAGLKLIMTAVADYSRLTTVSVAGNAMDVSAAKAVAYATAFNRTVQSLCLVHCDLEFEAKRHITAGIVSNSRISLRQLAGLRLGPMVVTLGFPSELESWNNAQVLSFCKSMWEHHRSGNAVVNDQEAIQAQSDPLHFLNGTAGIRSTPEEAAIVVEVAKNAYSAMLNDGLQALARTSSRGSVIPSEGATSEIADPAWTMNPRNSVPAGVRSVLSSMPTRKTASFVARPEASSPSRPDPTRKRRLEEWVQENSRQLNELTEQPFNAGELWRLHQHYFSPVVNESGGESIAISPNPSTASVGPTICSVPEVTRTSSSEVPDGILSDTSTLSGSHPFGKSSNPASSQPMMKRKVSYRCLSEAAPVVASPQPVAMLIEGNPSLHSLPRKSKKARRNRTRISFLPRVKAKLDSYLDLSHDKALITMRQLRYVEKAILDGVVHLVDDEETRTHLCGVLAQDAETIVVDLL